MIGDFEKRREKLYDRKPYTDVCGCVYKDEILIKVCDMHYHKCGKREGPLHPYYSGYF